MPRKHIVNLSGDISQICGQAVCPEAALRLMARLIARAHVKKIIPKYGEGKSCQSHQKEKLRGI